MMPSALARSTYQPQPMVWLTSPSRSQPQEPPSRVLALQVAVSTVPALAATMTVLRAAPRSTPSWPGRSAVRQPDTIGACTGWVQAPDAPGMQPGSPSPLTPMGAPTVATSAIASAVHLAYASG